MLAARPHSAVSTRYLKFLNAYLCLVLGVYQSSGLSAVAEKQKAELSIRLWEGLCPTSLLLHI